MKILLKAVVFVLTLSLAHVSFAKAEKPLSSRTDVQTFINHMVKKHQFDKKQLTKWINGATIQQDILTSIAKPAEKLPWHRYETIFMSEKRIKEGAAFYQKHHKSLKRAEKEYGVPAEIITAIIGVESFYGQQRGKYTVFDSLITLGFNYPPRSKFFLSELEQFLLLAREEHWDPATIRGSYAGAMGAPQFISSSYRRWAVDANNKGSRDLIGNMDDAIASVANYFKIHGWKANQPIAFPAIVKGEKYKSHLASKNNPVPDLEYQKLGYLGIRIPALTKQIKTQANTQKFALLEFEGKDKNEYWICANNFYVITRYNHSDRYAMAVFTLSKKIKLAYEESLKRVG